MLVRKEGAANMVRLRVRSGHRAKSQEVRLASMIPSAPPAQPDHVELTKGREAIVEILGMNWGASPGGTQVDQVQIHWILQEEPHYTFVPAGSNEEVKIALAPRFPCACRM